LKSIFCLSVSLLLGLQSALWMDLLLFYLSQNPLSSCISLPVYANIVGIRNFNGGSKKKSTFGLRNSSLMLFLPYQNPLSFLHQSPASVCLFMQTELGLGI
jgi:hypothetical protein